MIPDQCHAAQFSRKVFKPISISENSVSENLITLIDPYSGFSGSVLKSTSIILVYYKNKAFNLDK
jgi:hypothetical protein